MAKKIQTSSKAIVPSDRIAQTILLVRGQKVILDFVLAELYGVETKALNQAVRRNLERFPDDFMFQLTKQEVTNLRSQIVTLKSPENASSRSQTVTLKQGMHIKYRPYAFTEQGIAMLSSVLRSSRAVQVNIEIMRAFVQLRKLLVTNEKLARQLETMEKKYDAQFKVVFDAIRELMKPPEPNKKRPIGFAPWKE